MKTMILASANEHKIEEFQEQFPDYHVQSLKDIGFDEEIEETGKTFEENSVIKARAVVQFLKRQKKNVDFVVADDSGLCVDALHGEPGIYSARYSGDHNPPANRARLLKELQGKENRKARFVCVLVKMTMDEHYKVYEGFVDGKILTEERGDNSFGYNSLFYSNELRKTFGEATIEERMNVSHRGRAIEKLKKDL